MGVVSYSKAAYKISGPSSEGQPRPTERGGPVPALPPPPAVAAAEARSGYQ